MKIVDEFEQNSEDWLAFRRGKIMGTTTVSAFTGKKKLKDFWQILADRIVMAPENIETAMDRGHRLEDEAIQKAAEKLGVKLYKKVAACVSDINPNLAYSPDRLIEPVDNKFVADIEAKCFEGAAHLESVINGYIPDKTQMLRPFTINPDLQTRYYVFYHDRISIPELSLHVMEIKREDYKIEIETLAERDAQALAEIDEILLRYF